MSAKLKTYTLGCKVNQYETQFVREGLIGVGYTDADKNTPADLCIINTCTITGEGDAKSRQIIRKMNRENPHARLVVMGCYATRDPDAVAALPGVAEVVTDKRELPDLLGRFGVRDIPNGISGLDGRHRAYVKVQDGCLLKCSYCIIPTVRPQMSSRPVAEIIDEVRRLVDNGYREVILTGIHLGHYGVDFNQGKPKSDWVRLSSLVKDICQIDGDFRVRLSSIEATEVTRELVEVMQDFSDQVCPHLHVCVQSGSDRILRRMKRRWTRKHIIDRCLHVKEQLQQPAFSTDLIVGFPGETDADFEDSIDACRQIGFSKIHMFPFSPRKTTPAAEMDDQIPKAIKQQRGRSVQQLESQLRADYFQSLVGRELQVLVESVGTDSGLNVDANSDTHSDTNSENAPSTSPNDATTIARGTSCRYAPVAVPGENLNDNDLVTVKAVASKGDHLVATTVLD